MTDADDYRDTDEHEATLPEIQSRRLREKLFIPELERLLGDPVDFPTNEDYDFDSMRVRLDSAIGTVEKRGEQLAAAAYSRTGTLRFGVALSAVLGIGALVTALGLPAYSILAFVVAAVELVLVLRFSAAARRHAIDCLELRELGERYRPQLERCHTAAELRTLAERIGTEMQQLWIAPVPADTA